MNPSCNFYEIERLRRMRIFETILQEKGYHKIAGVDEAGRGPLAGPVVVAACILPETFFLEGLNDSKKVAKNQREGLYNKIINFPGIIYSYIVINEKTIDQINIFQATLKGMKQAVLSLKTKPDYVLIDGNQLPDIEIPQEAIVSGDMHSISIAAASIIAKVTRDKIMIDIHEKYPNFSFKDHKGYATKKHIKEIETFGPTPIHRKSFEPVKSLLKNI